jgi:DNA-damage-inducible protein D
MDKIVLFQERRVRRVWQNNEWYFSIIDVVEVLTDSPTPSKYWGKVKKRLKEETLKELSPNWGKLKMQALDGKMYPTDAANTEGLLRIIMSIPSPKAEPFKMWLAHVGKQQMDEIENPELGFERLKDVYLAKGYSKEWVETRLKSIDIRKQLTDEWQERGVKEGQEYAILTAEIAKATFGLTPSEHKDLKGLERQNLRDHMTNLELVFTMLGEEITRSIAVRDDAIGFEENHDVARRAGNIAGTARENLEQKEGIKVVSPENFLKRIEDKEETE